MNLACRTVVREHRGAVFLQPGPPPLIETCEFFFKCLLSGKVHSLQPGTEKYKAKRGLDLWKGLTRTFTLERELLLPAHRKCVAAREGGQVLKKIQCNKNFCPIYFPLPGIILGSNVLRNYSHKNLDISAIQDLPSND